MDRHQRAKWGDEDQVADLGGIFRVVEGQLPANKGEYDQLGVPTQRVDTIRSSLEPLARDRIYILQFEDRLPFPDFLSGATTKTLRTLAEMKVEVKKLNSRYEVRESDDDPDRFERG